jgi:L-alanine-DL-glutamate epimerase-like enolase superfamily enzyme
MQHPFIPFMGTINGVDIALWDQAGKITGQPVSKHPGGPFREGCPMFSHVDALKNKYNKAACRARVAQLKPQPEGLDFFRFNIHQAFTVERPFHPTATSGQMRRLHRGLRRCPRSRGRIRLSF